MIKLLIIRETFLMGNPLKVIDIFLVNLTASISYNMISIVYQFKHLNILLTIKII